MENVFIFNPNTNPIDIQDAVTDRLSKAQATLTCLMFSVEFLETDLQLDRTTIYNSLCSIDEYLDQLNYLHQQMARLQKPHSHIY